MRLKYIVTNNNGFAIFDEGQTHAHIAKTMHGTSVGAGFCDIARLADSDFANVHCYGRSVSLDLESRPEDEQIINKAILPEGYEQPTARDL